MDNITENRYLEALLLVARNKVSAVQGLEYIKLIEEPPQDLDSLELQKQLDRIETAHQAGQLHIHKDGRPSKEAVRKLLAPIGNVKARYLWHAYSVERLGLPLFDARDNAAADDEVESDE